MAELQDEEKWLYGDEDREIGAKTEPLNPEESEKSLNKNDAENENTVNGGDTEQNETDKIAEDAAELEGTAGQKDGEEEGDDDSSSEDEPTVTIGKIVKQPDILRPPPPVHRSAPTSGLKEDDFNSAGKINGVPATEFSLAEMEEKPWRKPGADLSDYFNYGFTEDTWLLYCERQRKIRTNESGIGLSGLGVNVMKTMLGSSNISVPVINNDNKYGRPKPRYEDESIASVDNFHNTIQVMTADRRSYSNKVLTGPGYDEMDNNFNPNEPPPSTYPDGGEFFNAPPAPFFSQPPPPWGESPLPPTAIPPPGWTPNAPDMPPAGPPPNLPPPSYFEEEEQRRAGRDRSKLRSPSREEKERESRHHGSRRRSRSRSRSRPRHSRKRSKSRERTRSRSKSPSHRHKRKRSKRDREE